MAFRKTAAACGILVTLVALLALADLSLKRSYFQWNLDFIDGHNATSRQGGWLLHWYDARHGGLMHFDEAIIGHMRREPGNRAQIARGTEVLNRFDASNLRRPDQEAIVVERAALSALGGDKAEAARLATTYCKNDRPHQGSVPQCMKYALQFLSEKMGPQEAVYVYATAKLAYSIGAIDRTTADYYVALSTMLFSPEDSDRAMEDMARHNSLNRDLRGGLCSKAAYY